LRDPRSQKSTRNRVWTAPPVTPAALIFDVFGTLVDWRTSIASHVAAAFAARGRDIDALAFADAWRAEYQPAMERIRSGGRGYVPLDDLHRENLMAVLAATGHQADFDPQEIIDLARGWERLDPWPDVVSGLVRLKARRIIAPCSNGSIALMTRLARHAGLPWDCILGADLARGYKPQAAVYLASCAALRLEPGAVMMVAAHNTDLEAARGAGLMTAFIPRPDEHGPGQAGGIEPVQDWDACASNLNELAAKLA
jgi:2-haloacid dehalogenase